jgi:DMSO/TMAO reductase YedYZ molybdopterin-dependent catalytic subunit
MAEVTSTGAPEGPTPEQGEKPIGRRAVLAILGLGGLGIAFGEHVQNGISDLLKPLHGTGLAGLVPGGGNFTLYTVTSGFPARPPDYKLTVNGMVERPLQLSVRDLEALPATRLTHTFQCVTGWVVDDVRWTGVPLIYLAKLAGAHLSATVFHFSSFDGVYTETLTMDQAEQSGAIAAYSMLGGPVSRDHGGPVRLYVPGMFGYKSIKWLSTITLTDVVQEGYWEQNGYPVDAWINGHGPSAA